jgi:hypothetical protein
MYKHTKWKKIKIYSQFSVRNLRKLSEILILACFLFSLIFKKIFKNNKKPLYNIVDLSILYR